MSRWRVAAIAAMLAGFALVAAQPEDDGRTIEEVRAEIAKIEAELAALPNFDVDDGHFEFEEPTASECYAARLANMIPADVKCGGEK